VQAQRAGAFVERQARLGEVLPRIWALRLAISLTFQWSMVRPLWLTG
jgi:hypothetical protein